MRKVLMITQDVEVTRRILQEARTLRNAGYDVSILTRSADEQDRQGEVEGIPTVWVAVKGRDPRFGLLYRLVGLARGTQAAALWSVLTGRHTFTIRALPRAIAAKADVYHAHDLNNLEVAYKAARKVGAKLVYDAHELFPEMANRWVRLKRRAWRRLEAQLMPQTDLNLTVNDLIAEEMARRYHVQPPLVVLNCPDPPPTFDPSTRYNLIRERLALPDEKPVVLYQGWMSEGRGLENLVRAAPLLAKDAVVVFMGYGEYEADLQRLADAVGLGRVHFIPAVPQRDLLAYCASADVGVIPYQAVDLNNYYTSPNKLFDFIQAALPIVASDLPFLRRVIVGDNPSPNPSLRSSTDHRRRTTDDGRVGVVAKLDAAEDYALAINTVLEQEDGGAELRANLRRVAPRYTWEEQGRKLAEAYRVILNS